MSRCGGDPRKKPAAFRSDRRHGLPFGVTDLERELPDRAPLRRDDPHLQLCRTALPEANRCGKRFEAQGVQCRAELCPKVVVEHATVGVDRDPAGG